MVDCRKRPLRSQVMIVCLLVILLASCTSAFSSTPRSVSLSVEIKPPRTTKEWRQMAALLVGSEADESSSDLPNDNKSESSSLWESMHWNFRKTNRQRATLEEYVQKAERMRGNKFALLVAKHRGTVVGMVEMGVTSSERRSTVGVILVDPKCRGQGIGSLLLGRCEELCTSEGWNETVLYAEVEPSNLPALAFFKESGYIGDGRTVVATVRTRRKSEEKPHFLLYKSLDSKTS